MNVYGQRRMLNGAIMALSVAATGFGLLWLVLVVWTLLWNGFNAISPVLFAEMTPPPGSTGGLLNAIFGSVVMTFIATLIGTPTGILAGTFLAEYSRGSRFGEVVRFINDILLSAPSSPKWRAPETTTRPLSQTSFHLCVGPSSCASS